jgi:FkbM family methyltransferase
LKLVNGVFLPDEEEEMSKFLMADTVDGFGAYQLHKMLTALKYVTNWRNAIDVGAHCGLWSMRLTARFKNVFAFEPIERHRECFVLNAPEAELLPFALGAKETVVRLKKGEKSTGDTHIDPDGEYIADVKLLDSFSIPDVDFMKLDCEGFELFVLQGGERTIDKYRPVIIVEQKPGKAKQYGLGDTDAVTWLQQKGYQLRDVIAGDYILTPTVPE